MIDEMKALASEAIGATSPMTLEDLVEWVPAEITEPVRIGPISAMIRAITDPTRISKLMDEATARTEQTFKDAEGKPYRLTEAEAGAYVWLVAGLVDTDRQGRSLGFEQIVRISRKTGLDCMEAGGRVMELSGMTGAKVDEAKNG